MNINSAAFAAKHENHSSLDDIAKGLKSGCAKIKDGQYAIETTARKISTLRTKYKAVLTKEGRDPSLADNAKFMSAWWSDTHGFGHDCSQHSEAEAGVGCGTFRKVVVVNDPVEAADSEYID